jgi:hypothetical protein
VTTDELARSIASDDGYCACILHAHWRHVCMYVIRTALYCSISGPAGVDAIHSVHSARIHINSERRR